jgi:predicted esterase
VAATDDTLTALDYLIANANELNLDTDRIVLKGDSAGAITALTVAYCTDKFGIDRPPIAAVIDLSGVLTSSCDRGAVIGSGEPMLFVAHGTEDGGDTAFSNAVSIIDAAIAAEITYEFHPLEDVSHVWDEWEETTADGRSIGQAIFDFLDRVLFH